jgi:tRNA1(Val) A37 N6-methylase TrmN6
MKTADLNSVSAWNNCYDDGWQGVIVDDAFAHPAKFSYGLIVRIVKHMLANNWIEKADTVGDPFGGIGTGGIVCAANGLRWRGVELESRFVELANRNFKLNPWTRNGEARIIQGDSRNFASLIGQCQGVVTSPPYSDTQIIGGDQINRETIGKGVDFTRNHKNAAAKNYGPAKGNLASLPVGDVGAILTSPPYVSGGHHPDQTGAWNTNGGGQGQDRSTAGYGVTAGQLGAMPAGDISSVITSPPYSDTMTAPQQRELTNSANTTSSNETPNDYWHSVFRIYQECFKVLKPGGVICVVIKSFVRAGKIVPLPEQTWELLQHVGFEPIERVRAMLVREDSHPGLFDGPVVKKTSRKSFFRRLYESKYPGNEINFEEVLFLKKPNP